jgi:hypothetical protein
LYHQAMLQKIWQRPAGVGALLRLMLPALASTYAGATLPGLVAGLAAPLLRRDRLTFWIWSATLLGFGVVASIAGANVTANLILPYASLFLLLGSLTAVGLLVRPGVARVAGVVTTALILGQATLGSCVFLRQTLSPSVYWYAAQVLERIAVPEETRIMAGFPAQLGLPLNAEVQREESKRHERLAAKYGVTLPPTAPERNGSRSVVTKGYHIRSYCFSHYFDDLSEDQFGQVRPFLWPLQQDEWELQDWLDQGYTVFVVGNEPSLLRSPQESIRRFFDEVRQRGRLVADLPNNQRSLLWEPEIRIYQIDSAASGRKRHSQQSEGNTGPVPKGQASK